MEERLAEPVKKQVDKRIARLEQDLATAQSRMENSVYKTVTDMLRDQMETLLPDFPSVLEKTKNFDTFIKSQKNRTFKDDFGITILHVEEELNHLREEIGFIKTRYSPEFL